MLFQSLVLHAVWFLALGVALPDSEPTCPPLRDLPSECNHLLLNDAVPANNSARLVWNKNMERSGGSLYNISVEDATIYQTGLHDFYNFGNALNPYWFARGLAYYGGWSYQMLPGKRFWHDWYTTKFWLRYMPRYVPRSTCPNVTALTRMCTVCNGSCLLYPKIMFSIQDMLPTIQKDIRTAFEEWVAKHQDTFRRPVYEPTDVVIQDRCDERTLLKEPSYGPIGFSFYEPIASLKPPNIYLIRDKNLVGKYERTYNESFYPCIAIHAVLCNHLHYMSPTSRIHSVGYEDVSEDFARLLYAPIAFKGISSFSWWAGLASDGQVYSTPVTHHGMPLGDFGPRWHWSSVRAFTSGPISRMPPPRVNLSQLYRIIEWLSLN